MSEPKLPQPQLPRYREGEPGFPESAAEYAADMRDMCGPSERRAPVQGEYGARLRVPPGSIAWWEHEEAWRAYTVICGCDQSAERIAERHGFSYGELQMFLGRDPTTWKPVEAWSPIGGSR